MKNALVFSASLIALIMVIGCGVSKKALSDAEQRIESLRQKGVPDSSLSRAMVFLYQARDAKKRGNVGLAKMSQDSLRYLVAQAEAQYIKDMERLRPYIDSIRGEFAEKREEFTGLHRQRFDSLVGVVDSFAAMNWLLQAEAKAKEVVNFIPRLEFDQERAEEIKPKLPGTWTFTNVIKHSQDKSVHAVEKKIFKFRRDGSAEFIEKKKGKSGPFLKEDWEFRSWGKWDALGDTVHVLVDRFSSVKQDFEELHKKDGKKVWEKKPGPRYDSTITDNSQNRYITYQDLKLDFVKN